ncbi:MAG: HNH nuclease family protein [Deltaproteobacteria bacterium]|nr:HNH nuclease family protein [Deltaproteobacteria bacterium]
MPAKNRDAETDATARILAEGRRYQRGYRERALKLFPWVCARCTREFSLRKIHELTVHHLDHNHDNNPPDGSNWELLCTYCHENEHGRLADAEHYAEEKPGASGGSKPSMTHNPFANLTQLLEQRKQGK